MGRLARAFRSELGTASDGVEQASRVHPTHGERDSQRLFRKFGLSLNVPISELEVPAQEDAPPLTLPYLKIVDYMSLLLKKYPEILFAGHRPGPDAERLCREFWEGYQVFHPQHEIFKRFSNETLGKVLPIALHGDKGRGYMKLPLYCFMWESCIGPAEQLRVKAAKKGDKCRREYGGNMSCSCAERARNQLHPEDVDDRMCPLKRKRTSLKTPYKTMCIEHNGKGHVFLSHFLGTCMPSKMFKAHPQLVDKYLEEVAREMTQLFHVGLECDAGTFYAACIGVKGDFEYHMEVAKLTRNYLNVGTVNDRPFCPYCRAGDPNIPAIDLQDTPAFQATLYSDNPWDSLPVLNHIPYDGTMPASLYRKDVFHSLKYGFLRDLNAGVIIWLSELGLFDSAGDSTSIDSRLERAYSCFKFWCVAASKTTTLRKFSKENLHRQTRAKFPYTSGKGSDSIVLMQWLQWFVRLKLISPNVPEKQLLMAMQETIEGGLAFCGIMQSHNLLMPAVCAKFQHKNGLRLLRGYAYLAARSMNWQPPLRLFALRPKCHFFHHLLLELKTQVDSGAHTVLNVGACFNCESNEDMVGRISRISRRVSAKLATKRTIGRYLLGARLIFKRAGLEIRG